VPKKNKVFRGGAAELRRHASTANISLNWEFNGPSPASTGLIVEPALAGDNNVVTVIPDAETNALRLEVKAVPVKRKSPSGMSRT
jgi:hypothetical protein